MSEGIGVRSEEIRGQRSEPQRTEVRGRRPELQKIFCHGFHGLHG